MSQEFIRSYVKFFLLSGAKVNFRNHSPCERGPKPSWRSFAGLFRAERRTAATLTSQIAARRCSRGLKPPRESVWWLVRREAALLATARCGNLLSYWSAAPGRKGTSEEDLSRTRDLRRGPT